MSEIKITPGELIEQANQMTALQKSYENLFSEIKSELNSINGNWSSFLASNFMGKISSAQKSFNAVTSMLESGAKAALTSATQFSDIDAILSKLMKNEGTVHISSSGIKHGGAGKTFYVGKAKKISASGVKSIIKKSIIGIIVGAICKGVNDFISKLKNVIHSSNENEIDQTHSEKEETHEENSVPTPTKSIDDDDVFLTQPKDSFTCTLYAAMNMMRRKAILSGREDWNSIYEDNVKNDLWDNGLKGEFSSNGMNVKCTEIGNLSYDEKKARLIQELTEHPEGIEVFDRAGQSPHAVLLTNYDPNTDKFYCFDSDPGRQYFIYGNNGKIIELGQSYIGGANYGIGQEEVINRIDCYWSIVG